jgi:hypothetical protein
MTEIEWVSCTDPQKMLKCLRGKGSDRKFRSFACACCRLVWHFLTDRRCRAAVEQAERYADRQASKESLPPLRVEARKAVRGQDIPYWRQRAFHACLNAVEGRPAPDIAKGAAINASSAVLYKPSDRGMEYKTALAAQVALLRDLFNPFRPVSVEPTWLTATVTSLARAAYEERALPSGELDAELLAVLADALEDAGCDNADILGHLRGPGPHVRGCWGVDLLLGKE